MNVFRDVSKQLKFCREWLNDESLFKAWLAWSQSNTSEGFLVRILWSGVLIRREVLWHVWSSTVMRTTAGQVGLSQSSRVATRGSCDSYATHVTKWRHRRWGVPADGATHRWKRTGSGLEIDAAARPEMRENQRQCPAQIDRSPRSGQQSPARAPERPSCINVWRRWSTPGRRRRPPPPSLVKARRADAQGREGAWRLFSVQIASISGDVREPVIQRRSPNVSLFRLFVFTATTTSLTVRPEFYVSARWLLLYWLFSSSVGTNTVVSASSSI